MGEDERFDLLILDGRHLLWRAASVFGDLTTNVGGEDRRTGATYGFLRVALKCWEQFGGKTFVAWDRKEGPTVRRALYSGYKARSPVKPEMEEMMDDMRRQEGDLKGLLQIIGIWQASAEGWEADDVIATLCERFGKKHTIGILSGDRDLLQLVTDKICLIRPLPKGQFKLESPSSVMTDFEMTPKQILDLKALAGDSSDKIPGAPGIGPKTATKLIKEHGGWQKTLEWAVQNQSPKMLKWHQSLVENADLVAMSAKLATLESPVKLDVILPRQDRKRIFQELMRLKMRSLLSDGRPQQLMAMG